MRVSLVPAGLLAAMLAAGACTPIRSHQGYVVDADLVNSLQPGVDNRQSVQQTLGTPSFTSEFGGGSWYYVSRESGTLAFRDPRTISQLTLEVQFDANGTVRAVRRGDAKQIASITPYGKTTPTLGRTRGFFQDLFGNIGTVGAAGGPVGGTNRDGGGRNAP